MVTKEGCTKGKPLANQLWSPRDTQRENPLLPIMVTQRENPFIPNIHIHSKKIAGTVNIGFSIETAYSLTMPLIGLTESLGNPVEPS